ncbi:unnamed protein product [Ectocarpus sp. 12 AP-2014]
MYPWYVPDGGRLLVVGVYLLLQSPCVSPTHLIQRGFGMRERDRRTARAALRKCVDGLRGKFYPCQLLSRTTASSRHAAPVPCSFPCHNSTHCRELSDSTTTFGLHTLHHDEFSPAHVQRPSRTRTYIKGPRFASRRRSFLAWRCGELPSHFHDICLVLGPHSIATTPPRPVPYERH